MALINRFVQPRPQVDVLGMGIEGFEQGQTDRKAFDAQQVLAGRTGTKPPTFLEQLTGMFGGQQANSVGQPAVGTNLDTLMRAGTPQPVAASDALVSNSHAAANAATDPGLADYFANARAAESGGNDQAANPKSSALGRYQFLEGTWNGLMQQHPELGLTADGRTDPEQQERAMRAFTQENAAALAAKGLAVNPGSLYAAHFLGAGGASNVLGQDPSSPMSAYVDPGVIQANPQLANMSVGEFIDWTNSKGGNSSGGYSAPMPYDQPREGTAREFTPEELGILLASEETRPFAMQYLQNQQQAGRFETRELPDGSVQQIDRMTGQVEFLREPSAPAQRRIVQGPDGNSYYEDGSRVLPGVDAPPAAADQPADVQEYQFYAEQERAAGREPLSIIDYNQALKGNGLTVTTNPDGTTTVQQGGAPKPLTEGQSKDTVYATRASNALPTIDALEDKLLSLPENMAGGVPVIGNYLQSEDYQVARDAGLEYLASILRKDTGAAVTPSEEALYGRIFLPQPGDKPQTVDMKRQRRSLAVEAIKAGMPQQALENMARALDAGGAAQPAPVPTGGNAPVTITDDAGFDALPSGAQFIGPDGQLRVKP